MKILIDLGHPAHIHFFRLAIEQLRQRGCQVLLTVQLKDVMRELLDAYGLAYERVDNPAMPAMLRPLKVAVRDSRLLRVMRRFQPDVVSAIGGMWAAQAAFLYGCPSVVWDDTEHHKWGHRACWPFASVIYSPDCYLLKPVRKQILYPGVHELAYLHPSRFEPSAEVVRSVGLNPQQPYAIVRLVSWEAVHDIGQHGFQKERLLTFLRRLEPFVQPLITSEKPLPPELEPYRLNIPPHLIHHVLAFACLCVGEGATMLSEAALLGTPGVFVSTLRAGTLNRLEQFGLLKQTSDMEQALQMALEWLNDAQAKEKCRKRLQEYLKGRMDVTDWIVQVLEKHGRRS